MALNNLFRSLFSQMHFSSCFNILWDFMRPVFLRTHTPFTHSMCMFLMFSFQMYSIHFGLINTQKRKKYWRKMRILLVLYWKKQTRKARPNEWKRNVQSIYDTQIKYVEQGNKIVESPPCTHTQRDKQRVFIQIANENAVSFEVYIVHVSCDFSILCQTHAENHLFRKAIILSIFELLSWNQAKNGK